MKYKVGDKVRIKSLDWYNKNKDDYGYVWCTEFLFTPEHSKYCGRELTISHITEFEIPSYVMENNGHDWTAEMIEGLVEELLDKEMEEHQRMCDEIMDIQGIEPIEAEMEQIIHCPEGYIFKDENGNVVNTHKIVLEKKKKEYPKTYEECCKIIDYVLTGETIIGYKTSLLRSLQKLLICRDAYWKIAGDEMELGKPWSPDLLDDNQPKFVLANWDNTIENRDYSTNKNYILTFPTAEMRDVFYENFKELIEQCKELL